jgi:menaquinone-dependent protoporphyrinogen oxidase
MSVLIAYASKHGATEGIARKIGGVLSAHGISVVVSNVERVTCAAGYDAVIMGSAVYMGRWMKAATQFVTDHSTELANTPVWLFSSGPLGEPLRPYDAVDIAEIARKIRPREHRILAGKLDRRQLHFGEKAITRLVRTPEGDFRNWREVRAWANWIARVLEGQHTSSVPARKIPVRVTTSTEIT